MVNNTDDFKEFSLTHKDNKHFTLTLQEYYEH